MPLITKGKLTAAWAQRLMERSAEELGCQIVELFDVKFQLVGFNSTHFFYLAVVEGEPVVASNYPDGPEWDAEQPEHGVYLGHW